MKFEVAKAGYQNQQQSLSCLQLPVKQEQPEIVDEVVKIVETSTPPAETMQKCKERKLKNADIVAEKFLLKKKNEMKK